MKRKLSTRRRPSIATIAFLLLANHVEKKRQKPFGGTKTGKTTGLKSFLAYLLSHARSSRKQCNNNGKCSPLHNTAVYLTRTLKLTACAEWICRHLGSCMHWSVLFLDVPVHQRQDCVLSSGPIVLRLIYLSEAIDLSHDSSRSK